MSNSGTFGDADSQERESLLLDKVIEKNIFQTIYPMK
jgi:hypothetical protein